MTKSRTENNWSMKPIVVAVSVIVLANSQLTGSNIETSNSHGNASSLLESVHEDTSTTKAQPSSFEYRPVSKHQIRNYTKTVSYQAPPNFNIDQSSIPKTTPYVYDVKNKVSGQIHDVTASVLPITAEASAAIMAESLLSASLSSSSSTSSSSSRKSDALWNPSTTITFLHREKDHSQLRGQGQYPKPAVSLGVLLPFNEERPFVIMKVAPAIEMAVDRVATKMGPWNFNSLTVLYGDSACNIGEAMNQAINFAERLKISSFLGPVCDYAVAPVARQAKYWNIPIISAGGTAYDFYLYKQKVYSTLTRVGPANLQGCIEFLHVILKRYNWDKLLVVYHSEGQDKPLYGLCHLFAEYQHYSFKERGIWAAHYKLDSGVPSDPEDVLRSAVGTDYSAIYKHPYLHYHFMKIYANQSDSYGQEDSTNNEMDTISHLLDQTSLVTSSIQRCRSEKDIGLTS